jgi:uncharacterized integral membrane protein (TIGR00698 family)
VTPSAAEAPRAADTNIWPGLLLCVAVSLAAAAVHWTERAWIGQSWLDTLVIAILLGTVIRTAWNPGARNQPGINFTGKFLLEVAVVLLGASLSTAAIVAAGAPLVLGIFAVVGVAILVSYTIGRMAGLPKPMAMLIACGNSICGNSAIAAVAPVIGANPKDVASSIAFTAVLGVVVVLLLPGVAMMLALTPRQSGMLAGMTVYAVPQVLAAAASMGEVATQNGVLVKLIRVMALGPLVLILSLLVARERTAPRPGLSQLVPWFVIGFVVALTARSLGLIPAQLLPVLAGTANLLTILSMAALGLSVDVRAIARVGPRAILTVVMSLLALLLLSLALIRLAA